MHEIIISKARRQLCVRQNNRDVFTCRIGLGPCPIGHKRVEGDGRTPVGQYRVCTRNDRSKYTLFLGLSYPGTSDAQTALLRGDITRAQLQSIMDAHDAGNRPPWDTPLGGEIGIHGGGIVQGSGLADSTMGCIALMDEDIYILWELAPMETPVTIQP